MKTVFVVTSGRYDSHQVEGVFFDEILANEFAKQIKGYEHTRVVKYEPMTGNDLPLAPGLLYYFVRISSSEYTIQKLNAQEFALEFPNERFSEVAKHLPDESFVDSFNAFAVIAQNEDRAIYLAQKALSELNKV